MFMGTDAFLFYFPVLSDYLRSIPDAESDDDNIANIIACCIYAQFDADADGILGSIASEALDLTVFVRDNIGRFGGDPDERDRVADAWCRLASKIAEKFGLS